TSIWQLVFFSGHQILVLFFSALWYSGKFPKEGDEKWCLVNFYRVRESWMSGHEENYSTS
ncbi:MAG TPA: hypothetical protein PLD61_08330, partial [Bacillota bacterium]|nr:hypothetical protein [Bacillota bacterium]